MNTDLNKMYNQPIKHDKFSRIDRLDAEITTVKELLKEAIDYNDILGVHSYTSRLDDLSTERKDLAIKLVMRNNQYSL